MLETALSTIDNRRQRNLMSDKVLRFFAAEDYIGPILAGGDNGPWTLDQLHEEDLLNHLKGRAWTQVPPEFLARHLGDFVLLTAEAFAAFIPAWLLFSLYNDHQGGEFVAHTFAPDEINGSSKIRPLSIEMFRALQPGQRLVLRDFLIFLAEYHPSDFLADRAAAAVDAISELIAVFEPSTESVPGSRPETWP